MALWLYQLKDLAKISEHLHLMDSPGFTEYLSLDGGLTVRDDSDEVVGWFVLSDDAWVFQESPANAAIPITPDNTL